jgi:hypothetical protein
VGVPAPLQHKTIHIRLALLLLLLAFKTGVQTPALAAVMPAGGAAVGAAGAKTYRCIKGYQVNGTSMGDVQVRASRCYDLDSITSTMPYMYRSYSVCG